MSTILGIRPLNRSAKQGIGIKDVVTNKTTFVNIENKRVARDLARHMTLGQSITANPARFQLDTATIDQGGVVSPRTGSLVLDVSAVNYTSLDGASKGTVAAGTLTLTPNATNPLVQAIGIDTSTFATGALAQATAVAAAAANLEQRVQQFPGSFTLAGLDTTASRTWLALVWVPPSITTLTSVSGTGVFTTGSAHGYVVGDQVWLSGLTGGTGLVANQLYTVVTVPSTTTFTLNTTHSSNVTAGTVQRQILATDVIDIRP
jgi:hypothetical protein